MRKFTRLLTIILAIAMIVTTFAGCGNSSSSAGTSGAASNNNPSNATSNTPKSRSVTMGINTQVATLDPWNGASSGVLYLQEAMHDSLFVIAKMGGKMESDIGKSYTVSEDGQTLTVEIYDYVTDSAGNKITASDVAWSYKSAVAKGNATQVARYLESAEALDDTTVVFHLNADKCKETSAPESVLTGVVIYSEAAYDEALWATNPIGTGPYMLEEFITGASVTLVKNENYWQKDESLRPGLKKQNVDKCIIKIILEDAQLALALESGDVDCVNTVSMDNLPFFTDGNGNALDGYTVEAFNGNLALHGTFNMFPGAGSKVAEDVNLRKAIIYALDREAIVNTVMGRTAQPIGGFYTPIYPDYNADWDNRDPEYNVETAKEYLAKSNYVANGSPTLKIAVQNNDAKSKAAQMIQNYLAVVGINAEVAVMDTALFDNYKMDFSQWDIKIDNVGNKFSLTTMWSTVLTSSRTTFNGAPCSFHGLPAGELDKLCATANNVDTRSQEAVDAIFDYCNDNAILFGLWMPINSIAGQSGIKSYATNYLFNLQPWANEFADDYVGVADR